MDNRLNTLGLCAKARKIVTGEDLVLESIRNKRAKLVFLASDAGVNTKKSITDKASYYDVLVDESFTTDELNQAIGTKNRKVVAITDVGFSKILKK